MVAMASLFERLNAGRPATESSEQEKTQSIERLLSWLVNNWPQDTITLRQLRIYGPNPLRNETKAILGLAQDLCTRGWISPIKAQRCDSKVWKIAPRSHHPQT